MENVSRTEEGLRISSTTSLLTVPVSSAKQARHLVQAHQIAVSRDGKRVASVCIGEKGTLEFQVNGVSLACPAFTQAMIFDAGQADDEDPGGLLVWLDPVNASVDPPGLYRVHDGWHLICTLNTPSWTAQTPHGCVILGKARDDQKIRVYLPHHYTIEGMTVGDAAGNPIPSLCAATVLADGTVQVVRRVPDGYEHAVFGPEGQMGESRIIPYHPEILVLPLGDAWVDLKLYNDGYDAGLPKSRIRHGAVERAWCAPDASSIVLCERVVSGRGDAPLRRLVRIAPDGMRTRLIEDTFACPEQTHVVYTPDGNIVAHVLVNGEAKTVATRPQVLDIALMEGERVLQLLVADDGSLYGYVCRGPESDRVVIGDETVFTAEVMWDVRYKDGELRFNAIKEGQIIHATYP